MYDGIDSSMPRKTTLAAEPVSSKGINITSPGVADVGLTEWCTQTETNSYPGCLIIHSCRPKEETGSVCIQAPDSLVAVAK